MLAPLDSPIMAGFVALLPTVNAEADRSPGFVWRLETSDGDATSIRAFDDPMILVNMSVWESVEALKDFVYRSGHVVPLRDRGQWFERPQQAHLAMWWIPAGHIPTVEEARERLEYLRTHGPSGFAFTFTALFAPPAAAVEATTSS